MKVIKGINKLRQRYKRPVLTMGMFDGVHLAHQQIISQLVRQAKALGGTSMVLTFEPHPLNILGNGSSTRLITPLEHRIALIAKLNVDLCVVVNFNRRFSQVPARTFIEQVLVRTIGVDTVIVGERLHFGKDRCGSLALLEELSLKYGFKVRRMKTIKINKQIISSTRIRALIQKGKISQANCFLGRSFSLSGRVQKGKARGRILGYPTANITAEQEIIPAWGVYAVLVKLNNKLLPGILNIGYRPTFHSKRYHHTIEVHIFNFRKKIYGQRLEISFIQRIRPEKKFTSHQALLKQIKKDEQKAKKILNRKIPPQY